MKKNYERTFLPNMDSIRNHRVPDWYHADKLGIFIHWGLYSVPAYAPPSGELGEIETDINWYSNNPYSEWYMNSVRIGKGPSYEHHVEKYGEDYDYNNFVKDFTAENYNPKEWVKLFKEAGARYVIPTTKHHDGYCLWDSQYTDFTSAKTTPKRDLISELAEAVREGGLRLGLYYSGHLDWQYASTPITDNTDLYNPPNVTSAYADYAYNQVIELIDKFAPSVLWNDIAWPYKGHSDLPMLFAYYYNHVKEGVVNDRWSGIWHDFTTKEYKQGGMDLENKWEMCRGLGLSFAYNQAEDEKHIISTHDLIALLVKTVAHNGNLLINVGPKADGSIPEIQKQRLLDLGAWLKVNGDAIYGTSIWERPMDFLAHNQTVYYTKKDDAVFALIDGVEAHTENVQIVLPQHKKTYKKLSALGYTENEITIKQVEDDIVVNIKKLADDPKVLALKFLR